MKLIRTVNMRAEEADVEELQFSSCQNINMCYVHILCMAKLHSENTREELLEEQ